MTHAAPDTHSLLIELGTEELPPKSLKALGQTFAKGVFNALCEQQLVASGQNHHDNDHRRYHWFAAPRRLAVLIPQVATAQPTQQEQRRGPAVKAAFSDDGSPTPAALGFAKSCGVEVDALERLKTDQGEWLLFQQTVAGKPASTLIQAAIEQANKQLPIAKRMRWGEGDAEFVRPVHWLMALHGASIVPVTLFGLTAGNQTRGHRFHSSADIRLNTADDYAAVMTQQAHIMADFDARQHTIHEQITALAKHVGGHVADDAALLDEVTALVEWPQALLGDIDPEFMAVPQECLVSSMRDHQKYFHVIDDNGALLPHFITVSNIVSKDPQRVRQGNERVLRARLSDARFFWETDKQQPLAERLPALDSVLFHVKLGSIGNKVQRISQLAAGIVESLGGDVTLAKRAAQLAKADLVTNMVGEFPELQGIMGRYYAANDNEPPAVGDAIEQHYWPRFAGDKLPVSTEAQAVALADKLDSLTGIFATGELPTGDRDPYGLRRAALGILRILIEQNQPLSLTQLVALAADAYTAQDIHLDDQQQQQIVTFLLERLRAYYQAQGLPTDRINAVLACRPERPTDFDARLRAVNEFMQLDEATDLAAANKRIGNILKKSTLDGSATVDKALLEAGPEQQLAEAIETAEQQCLPLFDQGDYSTGLQRLATLRNTVDAYFDSVMVMVDDDALKNNRLRLLKQLQDLFLRVADISALS